MRDKPKHLWHNESLKHFPFLLEIKGQHQTSCQCTTQLLPVTAEGADRMKIVRELPNVIIKTSIFRFGIPSQGQGSMAGIQKETIATSIITEPFSCSVWFYTKIQWRLVADPLSSILCSRCYWQQMTDYIYIILEIKGLSHQTYW